MVKEINNLNELNENLKQGITIVDTYATWCGPCKMLAPIIEELSSNPKYNCLKADIDKANDIANAYQIFSIPTLLIFKDKVLVNKLVGFRPLETLIKELESI